MNLPRNQILIGDAFERLKDLPSASIQCCVTSPPYWGLRDYGAAGQLGLERTPDEYVDRMVALFREVWRVLRQDGVIWVVLGDSYCTRPNSGAGWATSTLTKPKGRARKIQIAQEASKIGSPAAIRDFSGLKNKDLCGIPWRTAFALQADGWYLRSDNIWNKPNPIPESVKDRTTKSHEYIFMLTKSEHYFWDPEAIKEESSGIPGGKFGAGGKEVGRFRTDASRDRPEFTGFRNKRSVWTITTKPYSGAHFATYPQDLVEPCILSSTPEWGSCGRCGAPYQREIEKITENRSNAARAGTEIEGKGHPSSQVREDHDIRNGPVTITKTVGWQPTCECFGRFETKRIETPNEFFPWKKVKIYKPRIPLGEHPIRPAVVLDPFGGSGTTGLVASRLGRDYILIELNPEYAKMAENRTAQGKLL